MQFHVNEIARPLYGRNALPRRAISQNLVAVMRISSLLLALLTVAVSALKAEEAAAQRLKALKLTMQARNEPLIQVLRKIEQATPLRFAYNATQVNGNQLVNAAFNDTPLEDVLNTLLVKRSYAWKERGNNIMISVNTGAAGKPAVDSFVLRGRVLTQEEPPQPIPGTTVAVKGTTKGVITDPDGFFEVKAQANEVLVFSVIGYKPKEYTVQRNQRNLVISLQENVSGLNELVVTGFSEQKVKHMASSVATVNLSNVNNKPITQLSQALQGGVTGINVNQGSGLPGGDAAAIKIRGVGTFLSSDPLVLVDGVPFDMNKLDPNTIESISVLKDAAAASLYGARAGNGVIIITTKRGVPGVVNVQYNGYAGTQTPVYSPEFVDAATYMRMTNEAIRNNGGDPLYSEDVIRQTADRSDPVKYPSTNWKDEVIHQQSQIQQHSMSVSGGNSAARFALTASYLSQQGMVKNSSFNKGNVRANTSVDLSKNIVVFMDLFASREEQNQPYALGRGAGGILGWAYTAPPNIAAKYPDKPERPGYTYYGTYGESWNPVANTERGGVSNRVRDEILINLRPKWEIIPGLTLKGQFSYRVSSGADKTNRDAYIFFDYFTNQKTGRDFTDIKSAGPSNRSGYYYTGGNLDYNKSFGKHRVNAVLGYSKEMNNPDPWKEITLASVFGKVYYSYADRYLLEAGMRRDGSSIFAPGKKWGNFPSIAVGWNLGNEAFMKPLTFLDQLKLRGSYGRLGNNAIDPYMYQSTVDPGNGKESTFGNPNITWEKVAILDIGADISLFKNKLDVTFDWYNKKTSDLILRPQPTLTSAIGLTPINIGTMKNAGWEVKLSYNTNVGKNVNIAVNAGYSRNKSTLLKMAQTLPLIEGNTIREVGGAFAEYYGFKSLGLIQQGDIEKGIAIIPGQAAGDIRYADIDNNGVIDDNDKVKLGATEPYSSYFGSISVKWKRFDFETMITGIGQVVNFYNGRIAIPFNAASEGGTPLTWHMDYWTPENPGARFPRLLPSPGPNEKVSDFWSVNGAYARVKYIQIGYQLPVSQTGRIKLKSIRVYLNAQNPLTITEMEVSDPETRGDETKYPIMKMYTAGLNISF
ncbi:TonB-linked outer membrane protein, SusC/RagA family [Chitinophaga eiseniae]|uniref:TonB-linked outer membrane protein, SusC/RagA family n=2 Tax=Chitinophaga eiseniae TaxID=634771 RepID=A0A1T4TR38_9BACT|nr:TonB-linked outer membrane protein, SusC/RagA family [Chitinophaga eiseniae]